MICLHFLCLSNHKFMSLPAPCFSLSLNLCPCSYFLLKHLFYQTLFNNFYLSFLIPTLGFTLSRRTSQTPIFSSLQNICLSPIDSDDIYLCLPPPLYHGSLKERSILSNLSVNLFVQPSNIIIIQSLVTLSFHHFSPSLLQKWSFLSSLVLFSEHNIPL